MGQKVFICYSHQDKRYLDRLRVHLRPLERSGIVDVWSDIRIRTGQFWETEIDEALESAGVAVLLISADFLASDFIVEKELPALLAKAAGNGLRVVPVILSPSRYLQFADLSRYQPINDPRRPLLSLSKTEKEAVWVAVAREIESTITPSPPAEGPVDGQRTPLKRQNQNNREEGRYFIEKVLPDRIYSLPKKERPGRAILFADVDGLTVINKHHGMAVGDEVLQSIVNLLDQRRNLQQSGRCGDDTFFAFVRRADLPQAAILCEKLRSDIEAFAWHRITPSLRVTCSIGYSVLAAGEDPYDWITRAAYGMLESKRAGGNSVSPGPRYAGPAYAESELGAGDDRRRDFSIRRFFS